MYLKENIINCLILISREHRLEISISRIKEIVLSSNDLSIKGIEKCIKDMGFSCELVDIEKKKELLKKLPIKSLLEVVVNHEVKHLILRKITNNKIIALDSSNQIIRYDLEDFFNKWTGKVIIMKPDVKFNGIKTKKDLLKKIISILKIEKKLMKNIVLSSFLITCLGICGSFYPLILIDKIVPNNLTENLMYLSIIMIIMSFFKSLFESLRSMLIVYLSQNIDIYFLLGNYNHIMNLPLDFFSKNRAGDIVSRFSDSAKIKEVINSIIVTVTIDLIMSIVGSVLLYKQNSKLFYICIIWLLIYMLLLFLFRKPIMQHNKKVVVSNSKLNCEIIESIEGINLIKSFNSEKKIDEEVEKKFIKYIQHIFNYKYVNDIQVAIKDSIKGIFTILILALGSYMIIKGELSLGKLISFNCLLMYFVEPIERIFNLQPQIQQAVVSANRLVEIINIEEEKTKDENKKINTKSLYGNILFDNVSFGYNKEEKVLNDINLCIKAGQKVGIIGETGSGKTTIAKLIMGLYDIEKGNILINDYNILDVNRDILRKKISYISQNSYFFSGTIRENLIFDNLGISNDEIIECCKKVQIDEFINSIPTGYETRIEDRGSNLSGGIKQRLEIARALLRKPEILIMDEATSNIDPITEKIMEKTLEKETKGVTTIIIAHRLKTVKKCDSIFVMRKGKIVEQGTHNELIKKRGYYYDLWKVNLD